MSLWHNRWLVGLGGVAGYDEGFCHILKDAKIFEAVVLSYGWNMYKDVRALRFLVRRWNTDTHSFFFPWGETTITLEDVER